MRRLLCLPLLLSLPGCGPAPPARTFDRAFVSEAATATVAVVDLDRAVVERRIEVGFLPHNLVLSPDGSTLYAVLAGSQAVAVIDTRAATLRGTFLTAPVPRTRDDGTLIQPHLDQDAFSHTTCYDCHKDGGALPRYAGARPLALRLSPDGALLYVAHVNSGELAVLDARTGARQAAVTLAPVGAVKEPTALDLVGEDLVVAMRATQPSPVPGLIRRLDRRTLQPRGADWPTGTNPVELRALPGGERALVTRFDSNLVSLLDAGGGGPAITVANGPLGVLALGDGKVLVLGYYANAVSLLDPAAGSADTFALTEHGVTLSNPTHAARGSDPGVAWVVASGTQARLAALDLVRRQVLRSLPINGLSYDVAIVAGALSPR